MSNIGENTVFYVILDVGSPLGSNPRRIIGGDKMGKNTPDPSVLEYVLKVKKATEVNCELLGQALIFEAEMNAWIDELERGERVLEALEEMEEEKE